MRGTAVAHIFLGYGDETKHDLFYQLEIPVFDQIDDTKHLAPSQPIASANPLAHPI